MDAMDKTERPKLGEWVKVKKTAAKNRFTTNWKGERFAPDHPVSYEDVDIDGVYVGFRQWEIYKTANTWDQEKPEIMEVWLIFYDESKEAIFARPQDIVS